MHPRVLALLIAAAAVPAAAQAPAADAVGGVRYGVPAGYSRVGDAADSTLALYRDAASGGWMYVAALPRAEDRPARIAAIRRRVAGEVLGAAAPVDWELARAASFDPSDLFHQHLRTRSGNRTLYLSVRQIGAAGGSVLAGTAFTTPDDPASACAVVGNEPAARAEAALVASLLGRPAPGPLDTPGGPPAEPPAGGFREAPPSGGDPEAERARAAFAEYLRAARGHQAITADRIAPATVAYYADLGRLALHGTPGEVRALPLGQRAAVLLLRSRLDAAELAAMDGRAVFVSTIQRGSGPSPALEPGPATVSGDVATVPLNVAGRPVGHSATLVRVGGEWKVDLTAMHPEEECAIRGSLRAAGITRKNEDELLAARMKALGGRSPRADIWEPLARNPDRHE